MAAEDLILAVVSEHTTVQGSRLGVKTFQFHTDHI
jgi:hypothetical protein